MQLTRKIDFALNLLQSIPQDGPVELSYSGGKDSDVCLELARMSGIKFEAIYKNTTIDPPGTIGHCRENGVTILQPKESFLHIVERKGFPSRFMRFCCEILKEYKIYDRAIQGVRRSESTARAKRYKEPELCRVYPRGEKCRIYLPILEWTDADVAEFIKDRGIKCAPVYYDEQGRFQVSRRLGCIGCPLANRGGAERSLQALSRYDAGANQGPAKVLRHAPGYSGLQDVARECLGQIRKRPVFRQTARLFGGATGDVRITG